MFDKRHTKLVGAVSSFLLFGATQAFGAISYQVTVNTPSIAGTVGTLYFEVAAGSNSPDASVDISWFTTDGILSGVPATFGTATGGPLPLDFSLLSVSNVGSSYEHDFTFGSTLNFFITLAFTSPDPDLFDDDISFGLALYQTVPSVAALLNDGSKGDYIFTIDLSHLTGAGTYNYAFAPGLDDALFVDELPEPATLPLTVCGTLALALVPTFRRWRIRRSA